MSALEDAVVELLRRELPRAIRETDFDVDAAVESWVEHNDVGDYLSLDYDSIAEKSDADRLAKALIERLGRCDDADRLVSKVVAHVLPGLLPEHLPTAAGRAQQRQALEAYVEAECTKLRQQLQDQIESLRTALAARRADAAEVEGVRQAIGAEHTLARWTSEALAQLARDASAVVGRAEGILERRAALEREASAGSPERP